MFQRIQQYPLISDGARMYRPRAYADPQPDGTYDGWLVFFPLDGGRAIAADRETSQSNFDALVRWAVNVTPVYLEGALARALTIAEPPLLGDLARAEYEALEEAERLEAASQAEQAAADIDAEAAAANRETAAQIRHERVAAESALEAVTDVAADADRPRRKRKSQTHTK
jgi:hypothetical protein